MKWICSVFLPIKRPPRILTSSYILQEPRNNTKYHQSTKNIILIFQKLIKNNCWWENWSERVYLADIALRHVRGRSRERNSLVLTSELISSVNLLIAKPAQRRLVRAAQHARLRRLTHVTLYLHLLSLSLQSQHSLFLSLESYWDEMDNRFCYTGRLRWAWYFYEAKNSVVYVASLWDCRNVGDRQQKIWFSTWWSVHSTLFWVVVRGPPGSYVGSPTVGAVLANKFYYQLVGFGLDRCFHSPMLLFYPAVFYLSNFFCFLKYYNHFCLRINKHLSYFYFRDINFKWKVKLFIYYSCLFRKE